MAGAFGLAIVGAMTGGFVTWLLPTRLLGPPAMPGTSLIILPLLNGALMHVYGAWQGRRRTRASFAATFWGGASFAFGFAVVRLLMLAD